MVCYTRTLSHCKEHCSLLLVASTQQVADASVLTRQAESILQCNADYIVCRQARQFQLCIDTCVEMVGCHMPRNITYCCCLTTNCLHGLQQLFCANLIAVKQTVLHVGRPQHEEIDRRRTKTRG